MKKVYSLIILMFVITSISAQDVFPDSLNVYYVSLKTHLDYLKSQVHNKTMRQDKTLYIQVDDQVAEKIPAYIYDYKIVILDMQQIKEKAKGNFLPLVVIRPLELLSDGFILNLIDFVVVYKKRSLNYSNSGGSQIEFQYDCEKARFILKNKQHGGI